MQYTVRRVGLLASLAAAFCLVVAFMAFRPAPAAAFSNNPCWDGYIEYYTWETDSRCPYPMSDPNFWTGAHHYDYAEAWGGSNYLAHETCLEVWRQSDHTLRVRNCWSESGYQQAFLCGYPGLGCYWDVIDVWAEYASIQNPGEYVWSYGSTG